MRVSRRCEPQMQARTCDCMSCTKTSTSVKTSRETEAISIPLSNRINLFGKTYERNTPTPSRWHIYCWVPKSWVDLYTWLLEAEEVKVRNVHCVLHPTDTMRNTHLRGSAVRGTQPCKLSA